MLKNSGFKFIIHDLFFTEIPLDILTLRVLLKRVNVIVTFITHNSKVLKLNCIYSNYICDGFEYSILRNIPRVRLVVLVNTLALRRVCI